MLVSSAILVQNYEKRFKRKESGSITEMEKGMNNSKGGSKMKKLSEEKCVPCSEGADPLKHEEIEEHLQEVEGWENIEDKKIEKAFKFKDFADALDFTNKVGAIAEEEGHHPNIHLSWGRVKIQLYTAKIKGLHLNDFILAAKIDEIA